jgi:putative intracellular protease/amidase
MRDRRGPPGANWVDETAVSGGLLMASWKPGDIPAFNRAMIALSGGRREQRAAETSPQRRPEAWAAG